MKRPLNNWLFIGNNFLDFIVPEDICLFYCCVTIRKGITRDISKVNGILKISVKHLHKYQIQIDSLDMVEVHSIYIM